MKELKDSKAPGIDKMPAEFIKNSGEYVKNMLYKLVYRIYEKRKILRNFTKCIIVPRPKKTQEQIRANSIEY